MGYLATSKLVLFDEADLTSTQASGLDEIAHAIYERVASEVAPFDDLSIDRIAMPVVVSERFGRTVEGVGDFDDADRADILDVSDDWNAALQRIYRQHFRLPDPVAAAYLRSGETGPLKAYLQESLETGASYRAGADDVHKELLRSLGESWLPGFWANGAYYDSRSDQWCDERSRDHGAGARVIVEMHVIYAY